MFILTLFIQRTTEVSEQYRELESRLAHLAAVTGALSKRNYVDPNLTQRLESIAESVMSYLLVLTRLTCDYRSFSRLTACIEAKQERSTVRRVLESKSDVKEVKELLLKITARIEAFLVSAMRSPGTY